MNIYNFKKTLIAGSFAIALTIGGLTIAPYGAFASSDAEWRPTASETLIKMPTISMQKKIERDYKNSSLAGAIISKNSDLGLKRNSLNELGQALNQADGEMKIEVRHQILAQKRDYLNMVGERNEMRKEATNTRMKLYKDLLNRLKAEKRGLTPEKEALIANQEAARIRFESQMEAVDNALFADGPGKDSKYNQEYSKNQGLIEQLVANVNAHSANQVPEMDGNPISKQDYLRNLIAESESDLALIDQENQILGLMSKLVALDAMALSEEIETAQDIANGIDPEEDNNPLHAVADLFVNNG